MSGGGPETVTYADEIKRTGGPQTTDGKRWSVQLSAIPTQEWRDLLRATGHASSTVMPRRLEFDRASAVFESDENHVKPWIEAIDAWIAATNARHRINLERGRRDLSDRLDAAEKERERIQQLNDRFRDL